MGFAQNESYTFRTTEYTFTSLHMLLFIEMNKQKAQVQAKQRLTAIGFHPTSRTTGLLNLGSSIQIQQSVMFSKITTCIDLVLLFSEVLIRLHITKFCDTTNFMLTKT